MRFCQGVLVPGWNRVVVLCKATLVAGRHHWLNARIADTKEQVIGGEPQGFTCTLLVLTRKCLCRASRAKKIELALRTSGNTLRW